MTSANLSTDPSSQSGQVFITLNGSLVDFSPHSSRPSRITVSFDGKTALKHLVEALGVPHPDVRQDTVNGKVSILMVYVLIQDRIELFPGFGTGGLYTSLVPQFILDNHLGRLTVYLRLLGLDTLYNSNWVDVNLAETAFQQEHI